MTRNVARDTRGEGRRERGHIVPNSGVMNRANGLLASTSPVSRRSGRARRPIAVVREREAPAFLLELLLLHGPRAVEATVAHELDDAAQLVGVEPGAVLRAAVDDDPRSLSEVDPVHQLRAERAGDVAYRRHARPKASFAPATPRQETRRDVLLGAEPLEVRLREPDAAAALALVQGDAAQRERRSVPQPRGQASALVCACTAVIAAPQCAQCLLPTNTSPKHDGHAVVASRA